MLIRPTSEKLLGVAAQPRALAAAWVGLRGVWPCGSGGGLAPVAAPRLRPCVCPRPQGGVWARDQPRTLAPRRLLAKLKPACSAPRGASCAPSDRFAGRRCSQTLSGAALERRSATASGRGETARGLRAVPARRAAEPAWGARGGAPAFCPNEANKPRAAGALPTGRARAPRKIFETRFCALKREYFTKWRLWIQMLAIFPMQCSNPEKEQTKRSCGEQAGVSRAPP